MRAKRNANIDKAIKLAFRETAVEFDRANRAVITEPRDWGSGFGVTHRRNGEVVVGGYRNIKDLGNLKNSQRLQISELGKSATLSWNGNGETPPVLVYFGHATQGGNYVPGRPWTKVALKEVDLPQVFIDAFKESI
jgi:hypothetical protein